MQTRLGHLSDRLDGWIDLFFTNGLMMAVAVYPGIDEDRTLGLIPGYNT